MSYALDLRRFGEKAMDQFQVVARKVALEILRGVVLATPVKTGRARGGWQVAIGTPSMGQTDVVDQTGEQALARATSVIDSWDVEKVTLYITNNVIYIETLENGSSDQAPQGMLRVTLRRFPFIVEGSVS